MRITDLAIELVRSPKTSSNGILLDEKKLKHGVTVITTTVQTEAAAHRIGKPVGRYCCIDTTNKSDERDTLDYVAGVLGETLRSFQDSSASPQNDTKKTLVVGLGNNRFVADALGFKVCEALDTDKQLMTFTPSVSGVTGIKSTTAIKAIVTAVQPTIVIIIDSLVCHDINRLGASFQLCNTGIQPGSGITRDNDCLDAEFLGCPVIAVGVPLVSVMGSHFVVPKTIDAVVARCAYIISKSLCF